MQGKPKSHQNSGETQESGHYLRYPEEELIDVLEAEEDRSKEAGSELAEHFGAVTGRAGRTTGRKN